MKKKLVYEYISILHNNPQIIVLKQVSFLDEIPAWVYTIGGQDEYLMLEEELDFRILQLEYLK